jgi:hypothetical protein
MGAPRFTPDRRERLLLLLAGGASLSSACATVKVSRTTVAQWVARGRAGSDPEAIGFAKRVLAIRGVSNGHRVSDEEIEAALEAGTRRGSVTAARALMAARRRREEPETAAKDDLPPGHPLTWTSLDDPFLPLDSALLAYLTDEQRAQVRAIHADGDPRGEAVLDACLRWAEWARANLEPPYEIDWRALSNGRSPYPLSSPLPPRTRRSSMSPDERRDGGQPGT